MSDNPIELVHALNINLFAYYAKSAKKDDLTLSQISPETLRTIYQPILDQFAKEFGNPDQPFDFSHHQLITEDDPDQTIQSLLLNQQYLWLSSHAQNQHPNKPESLYKLFLYPQKLNGDTYSLFLNIYRPQQAGYDQVLVKDFSKFYPDSFILENKDILIGQTILVTAFLPQSTDTSQTNLRKIADFLRQELFADKSPNFYQDGYLLDSYICEYSQTNERSDRLLIIIYLDETTTEKIQPIYQRLPELFVAYHKIIYSFQSSRTWHQRANQKVSKIEDLLKDKIKTLKEREYDTTANLNILNKTLEDLLQTALDYSLELRNLDYALNTINIHQKNYQTILHEFQKSTHDQLEFFARFLQKSIFTSQIEADLNYLKPASNLLDQSINSIRGIVEIEQAKSDRSLERTIQIFGVGLGVGGIVSSTISGYIQEPINFTPDFSKPMHPGVLSLLISVFFGILFALITASIIYRHSLLAKIKKIFNQLKT